jgi:glycosyltransferase involved in cell wall biosynthesis
MGFKAIVERFDPTLTLITYVPYAGLVAEIPPSSLSVLDSIDVYQRIHKAYADQSLLKQMLARIRFGYRESGELYDSEREILGRYDGVIAISKLDELAYTRAGLRPQALGFLEACVKELATNASAAAVNKDIDVLFVGARFLGTERALAFLLDEVAPRLRRALQISVVGGIGILVPQHISGLSPAVRVEATGIVRDVFPFYERARVVAIPVPIGTGTSVKLQEAFSRGACVVTTTAGARLEGAIDGENCLIRDDSESFAKAIGDLLGDPERRIALGKTALETARRSYSADAVQTYLDRYIERLRRVKNSEQSEKTDNRLGGAARS